MKYPAKSLKYLLILARSHIMNIVRFIKFMPDREKIKQETPG